jgi:hypothetical protein
MEQPMTWFDDGDGWRDESTEGPYDTLKTMSIHNGTKWAGQWTIFSLKGHKFELTWKDYLDKTKDLKKSFKSIEEAKKYVSNH